MDLFDNWEKRKKRLFLNGNAKLAFFNDEYYFEDSVDGLLKMSCNVNLYARAIGREFEWAWKFQYSFPVCMDEVMKIKKLGLKGKQYINSPNEEIDLYELIGKHCNVDELVLISCIVGISKYDYIYGLTNIVELENPFKIKNNECEMVLNKFIINDRNTCANCEKKKTKLSRCSNCKRVLYCSIECQKEDWFKSHKNMCTKIISDTINHNNSEILNKLEN